MRYAILIAAVLFCICPTPPAEAGSLSLDVDAPEWVTREVANELPQVSAADRTSIPFKSDGTVIRDGEQDVASRLRNVHLLASAIEMKERDFHIGILL